MCYSMICIFNFYASFTFQGRDYGQWRAQTECAKRGNEAPLSLPKTQTVWSDSGMLNTLN